MTNPTQSEPITLELTELDASGKPLVSDSVYSLQDPQLLFAELVQALNEESEETFSTEALVDLKDGTPELYAVRFTRHASWGLMGKITHPTEGVFRFYCEFLRDA